ncbi:hypothetical protein DFH07DRAFT_850609 [Mycena maculata]|uniref:F-box domain-containing protein n=1 Tax=Mycena maculata TaxID=230809 RepID=A0AAD7HUX6_9AGAR|nr:hypothetical protein DFH07DRAFT_850609 [Mycena maculata]
MASPFASKLGTNYCPSAEEMVEIETLLVEPELRLKRLDEAIIEMQKALDKLTQERDTLGAYVHAHNALISPARRLPLDIIQEIFTACLPTHRNCVMSASEAPVLLGRICSAWREISLSTPRLWASLHLAVPQIDPWIETWSKEYTSDTSEQRLEVTRTWLHRSGQCPLSISMHSPDLAGVNTPQTSAFLQALIPFASRWQRIQFNIPASFTEILGQVAASDVPMLQSFTLYQGPRSQPHDLSWDFFGMTQARNISITGDNFVFSELPLRWSQLTTLSTVSPEGLAINTRISTETVLQTISRCPQLQSFSFEHAGGSELGTQISSSIIEHPLLEKLHCVGTDLTAVIHDVLRRLVLPGLKDFTLLWIENPNSMAVQDVSPLLCFLARSLHLKCLHMETEQFSTLHLQEILRSLPPTLQRLRITAPWVYDIHGTSTDSFNDDVLAVLTPTPGLATPCPDLKVLQMDQCITISYAAILQFITARIATLKRIRVDFAKEIELDKRPSLRLFIESGLDVSVTHTVSPELRFSPWDGLPDAPPPPSWGSAQQSLL